MDVIQKEDLVIIERLLEANHSPSGWQAFLDTLIDHFDLSCCNLYLLNPESQGIRFQEWSGKRPTDIQLNDYMLNYFHSDTTHSLMFSGPSGQWLTPNLRADRNILESTQAYQKWAIPNNFIYSTAATLFKDSNAICAIHFNRGAEKHPFTQDEENRFTALTPYIKKAVKLRLKIASKLPDHSLLEPTLNSFSLPVAILNEFGEVIAKNNLMRDLTLDSKDISFNQGIIKIQDENTDFNFQLSIANAISSAKNMPLEYSPKSISISNYSDIFKLGVCELIENNHRDDEIFLGAMVYLIKEKTEKNINLKLLESTFKLTPKEAKVCTLLLQNYSAANIAELEKNQYTPLENNLTAAMLKLVYAIN